MTRVPRAEPTPSVASPDPLYRYRGGTCERCRGQCQMRQHKDGGPWESICPCEPVRQERVGPDCEHEQRLEALESENRRLREQLTASAKAEQEAFERAEMLQHRLNELEAAGGEGHGGRDDLRELLSIAVDIIAAGGVTHQAEWERMLMLSGRLCEPYRSVDWEKRGNLDEVVSPKPRAVPLRGLRDRARDAAADVAVEALWASVEIVARGIERFRS